MNLLNNFMRKRSIQIEMLYLNTCQWYIPFDEKLLAPYYIKVTNLILT